MNKFSTLFWLLILAFQVSAQTEVSGIIESNTNWTLAQSPYYTSGNLLIEEGVTLNIEQGVVVKLGSLDAINVEGSLVANGTNSNPVVFTSIKDDEFGGDTNNDGNASVPSGGEWIAVNFRETSVNSSLNYCIIKHGGQTFDGAITVEGSSPTITNCSFIENEVGIKTRENASPSVNNNNFSNNLLTPIQVSLSSSFSSFSGNSFSNNQWNGIGIEAENYDGNYTLGVPTLEGLENVPYVVFENFTIEPTGSLNIEQGVVVKVDFIHVINIEGSLVANGTSSNPVVFTSIKDDEFGGDTNNDGNASVPSGGEWIAVNFRETSENSSLNYCIIKHGGQTFDGAITVEGSSPTITNCSFIENEVAIKKAGEDNIVLIDSSLFCNNSLAGIRVESGELIVSNCSFLNNSPYDIDNQGTSDIIAESNWWNHSTYTSILNTPLSNFPNIFDGNDNPSNGIVSVSNPNEPATKFNYDLSGFTVLFNNNTSDVESFYWDFGDGTQSNQVNPVHKYNSFGFYDVCLEPSDCDENAKGSVCETVIVKGVSNFYPNVSSNTNTFIGWIQGAGFTPNDIVKLYKTGEDDIIADSLIYIDSTIVKAFFTFNDEAIGNWNLSVEGAILDEQLIDVIQIEETKPIFLSTIVEGRERVRTNTPTKMRIGVTNQSNQTAFGVPVYVSFGPGIEVDVENEILVDTIPAEYTESFKGNLLMVVDEDTPTDTSLVGLFLMPEVGPYETRYLDIKIATANISDDNIISVSAGMPWFTAEDLIDEGVLYNFNGSLVFELPPCVECALSFAGVLENLPGIPGCFFTFAGTIYSGFQLGNSIVQGNGVTRNAVSLTVGLASSAICAATVGNVNLNTLGEALEGIAIGASGGVALAECEECLEEQFPPSEYEFESANSFDPNEKIGLNGAGVEQFINKQNELNYTIFFENVDTASAPASEVFITDIIDASTLNIETLKFTGFGFGNENINFITPIYDTTFTTDINLNPEKDIIVRVNGSVDYESNKIEWSLRSFDPLTMDLTEDIDLGFLPPNNNSPEGEGFVRFTIEHKPDLPHLTEINNGASIVFDNNQPIITPIWTNTIDIVSPTSQVIPLDNEIQDTTFLVSWDGNDNNESGIQYYDIYVSEDGQNYDIWQFRTTETSAEFTGQNNITYFFYSIATDRVGNVEEAPPVEDASTQIITGINEVSNEAAFKLYQNKPNPFSESTLIEFEIPRSSHVLLEAINEIGYKEVIANGQFSEGKHSIIWAPKSKANGMFYYRIRVGKFTRTKKMIILN